MSSRPLLPHFREKSPSNHENSLALESFIKSCDGSAEYPKNIVRPKIYALNLDVYAKRLELSQGQLFSDEFKAAVDVLDSGPKANGRTHDPEGLTRELELKVSQRSVDFA